MVAPLGMSNGGQMLWQLALHPAGFVYRAMPTLGVTRILPNPVRVASLTTTALVPVLAGPAWAKAMPAIVTVDPLIRSAATTARVVQDMPLRPGARRRVNLINATASFCRKFGRNQVSRTPRRARFTAEPGEFTGAGKDRSGRSSRG